MKIHDIAILFFIFWGSISQCAAQKIAVKTNLLYGTYASSPNLEGGQYNIAGHHLPLLFGDDSGPYRYEGWGIGGGISYGYHFLLGNRWSLEANIGIGYVRLHYDKFRCETCGEKTGTENRNYFGPTKAAVSLIFLIK